MVMSDSRTNVSDRRDHLLRVARDIFADRGYPATTMDDIAAAAGFTKPILYQHFSSKEALYNELVQSASTQLLEAFINATKDVSTPREMVQSAFRGYFDVIMHETAIFRLLFLQPHIGDHLSALRHVESRLTSYIEEMIPLRSDPTLRRQLAASIVGMAEGAATAWLVQQESAGWPQLVDGAVDEMAQRISGLAWGGLRSVQTDAR
jgi:AcrR family transcriptional regulator